MKEIAEIALQAHVYVDKDLIILYKRNHKDIRDDTKTLLAQYKDTGTALRLYKYNTRIMGQH